MKAATFTLASLLAAAPLCAEPVTVTLLHNNDAESQLLDAGPGREAFGGAARFVSLVDRLRSESVNPIVISSGDNFLAGPEFSASLAADTFYDALVLNASNYDAVILGNHDFDFGPDTLASFIAQTDNTIPFLSANLDVSAEPALASLQAAGRIASSTVVIADNGERVGIVGATTPQLSEISSPRNVVVQDVVTQANAAIAELQAQGINKIVFVSHLQSVNEDLAVIPQLIGVDVAIAGGGDELLANETDELVPVFNDAGELVRPTPDGLYPITEVTTADGTVIPIVTTQGSYNYVGQLEVAFDDDGNVTAFSGMPNDVADISVDPDDGVTPDPTIDATVTQPVRDFLDALASNVIAQTQVPLDGTRGNVRTQETNLGDLIADAFIDQATGLADSFGVDAPDIAIQNGGGIRNDSLLTAGDVTELNTFDILPFPNFLSVIENVDAASLKSAIENAVSGIENVAGSFAQIAGFSFVYDPDQAPGERVISITLDDGRQLVIDGQVIDPFATVNIATIDFLARGQDGYDVFESFDFTTLGITYQQALDNFIQDTLDGQISAADYPLTGLGRITTAAFPAPIIPTPAALPLGLTLLTLLLSRRRRRHQA